MKLLLSRFFWAFLTIMAVVAVIGGFYAAQFSVDYALASEGRSGGINPSKSLEFQDVAEGFGAKPSSKPKALQIVIFDIVELILALVGTILLVLILYAGYLWWSAGGNDEQVTKAKKTLVNAVIGILIIMISYSLTRFVFRTVFQTQVKSPSDDAGTELREFLETDLAN